VQTIFCFVNYFLHVKAKHQQIYFLNILSGTLSVSSRHYFLNYGFLDLNHKLLEIN